MKRYRLVWTTAPVEYDYSYCVRTDHYMDNDPTHSAVLIPVESVYAQTTRYASGLYWSTEDPLRQDILLADRQLTVDVDAFRQLLDYPFEGTVEEYREALVGQLQRQLDIIQGLVDDEKGDDQ